MRVDVGKSRRVKAGDIVIIRCSLPTSADYARLCVWSRVGDYEFSPHVQAAQALAVTVGEPNMLAPMYGTLSESRKTLEFKFIADDDDCEIVVRQEKDVATEPSARARITRHGKTRQNFVRRLRDAQRAIGRAAAFCLGQEQRNDLV